MTIPAMAPQIWFAPWPARTPGSGSSNALGRSGLASAIKEGLIAALYPIAVVMDSDGQHEPASVGEAVQLLDREGLDLVAGSRFLDHSEIRGLSDRRTDGSTLANRLARWSLPRSYRHLSDCMSGFIVLRLDRCLPLVRQVDVNGFKFFYELLAISRGRLQVGEIPLRFQPRLHGSSKLDLAVLWDFVVSLIHTATLRLLPRRAISFGLVGASGVVVQLLSTALLMGLFNLAFQQALPVAVITAASSNYLVNNALTFRDRRQSGRQLIRGLLKFLLVASLPALANVGLATSFYTLIQAHTLWAQLAGIVVVYVWNYAASSRFVWNNPLEADLAAHRPGKPAALMLALYQWNRCNRRSEKPEFQRNSGDLAPAGCLRLKSDW